jgi:hypothetical protein
LTPQTTPYGVSAWETTRTKLQNAITSPLASCQSYTSRSTPLTACHLPASLLNKFSVDDSTTTPWTAHPVFEDHSGLLRLITHTPPIRRRYTLYSRHCSWAFVKAWHKRVYLMTGSRDGTVPDAGFSNLLQALLSPIYRLLFIARFTHIHLPPVHQP